MKTLTISLNDAGQRLDKFLQKALPTLPISLLYKAIRLKKIKVNRHRTEGNTILKIGDTIELFLPPQYLDEKAVDLFFMHLKPDINIVFEDENIIIVDKKAGMICHSDEKETVGTLIDHIKAYLYIKGEYCPENEQSFVPSLCNRIDRNTAGLVISAKNAMALREINKAIKEHKIQKFYLCVCKGILAKKADTICGYIVKNSEKNQVEVFDAKPNNPNAVNFTTIYKVLSEKNNLSLLEVELETGRTHQIRASLAHIGHPLLGDGKYGKNSNDEYKTQALYSYKIVFSFEKDSPLNYLNSKIIEVETYRQLLLKSLFYK